MASRTYLPSLLRFLRIVCNYITRHRDRIVEVIGTNNASKLDDVLAACSVLTDVILPLLGDPV